MEGLIKGLIDVALVVAGADENKNNNRHNRNETGDEEEEEEEGGRGHSGSREEQSRSTWAQVVASGEQDDDAGCHRPPPPQQQHPQSFPPESSAWARPSAPNWKNSVQEEHGGGGRSDGDWETVGDNHRRENRQPRPHQTVVMMGHWNEYKRPPSEQEYVAEVGHGVDVEPSEEELNDLSKACSRLWELDLNRLVLGKDYEIDRGDGKKAYQKADMASGSLFSWLSDDVLRRPTYSRFCSLLDNYNPSQGCKEVITSQEKHEQAAFVEEISRTAPMKYLYKYLVSKGVIRSDYEEFKQTLTGLWFNLYGRGGVSGSSSAFEHVFVGEIKEQGECEVSGFHNWIQFYLEEAKGRVDYQGYIYPRWRGQTPHSETQLLTIQFEWNGVLKSLSSTLVGVSPEFEVALYTLCFYLGGEDNHVCVGPYAVNIKCYRLGNNKIGSVFPIAEC